MKRSTTKRPAPSRKLPTKTPQKKPAKILAEDHITKRCKIDDESYPDIPPQKLPNKSNVISKTVDCESKKSKKSTENQESDTDKMYTN